MEPKIIYQDEVVLVLDKPTGWVVTAVSSAKNSSTIENWLKYLKYPLAENTDKRRGIVHRLDKETSGLLLVAKTETALKNLQLQFKNRTVEKEYRLLVHGKVVPKAGEITVPVGRLPWNRERFGVLPGGRQSQTLYQVTDYFQYRLEDLSLIRAYPKTGRTHQIRIHFKYLGYPLVADTFYAGRRQAREDKQWCPRLFLHAAKIKFNHPESSEKLEFVSQLPADLQQVLDGLKPVASVS